MSGMVNTFMSSYELKEVDFRVIKEDFSRYMLEDGTTIKIKIVLRRVFFSPINTPEGYPTDSAYDTANAAVGVSVPQKLKRSPSSEPFNPLVDKGEEINFREQEINEQEYVTDNGFRIFIKPIITKVFRYNKYNQLGEPIYNVMSQQISNVEKMQSTGS